ncbi:MAG: DUF3997 domain-containing protein [Bacteroidales bacterium]|nr:DUF3997 domain-containing protein [Bacteroidales bacterium]
MIEMIRKVLSVIGLVLLIIGLFGILSDDTEWLGGGYTYYPGNKMILGEDSTCVDIPYAVEKMQFDRKYIIVLQCPRGRITDEEMFHGMKYNYVRGLDADYYWIIDKKENKVYPLLDGVQFGHLRDSLCIPLDFD